MEGTCRPWTWSWYAGSTSRGMGHPLSNLQRFDSQVELAVVDPDGIDPEGPIAVGPNESVPHSHTLEKIIDRPHVIQR